jgi:probable rRNA maturation factor
MFQIDVANQQNSLSVNKPRLRRAVKAVLEGESIARAQVSVAVVDDETIGRLNRRYLNHDHATDVLSFLLERDGDRLEGEVIVSGQTAAAAAGRYGWSGENELLLYVIHGTLHLAGYGDETRGEKLRMRRRERAYLAGFGLKPSGTK